MELLIKIPKEFEQQFKQDAFEDSLHRLSADAHLIAGLYEKETAKMLNDAFKNAIHVPQHGKLMDADAFIEKCEEMCDKEDGNQLDALVLLKWFLEQNAPTIIPPSEEETK